MLLIVARGDGVGGHTSLHRCATPAWGRFHYAIGAVDRQPGSIDHHHPLEQASAFTKTLANPHSKISAPITPVSLSHGE